MDIKKQMGIFLFLAGVIGISWILLDQLEQKMENNTQMITKGYHIIDIVDDQDYEISDHNFYRNLDTELDPLFKNRMEMFQINATKLNFHREVNFSKAQTPVSNMMLILQTMDSYNLCDEDWYIQMDMVIRNLKSQYAWNKNSTDPVIQHLMRLQVEIIKCMDQLMREADSDSVEELQDAFEYYYEYYQTLYGDGGKENEEV